MLNMRKVVQNRWSECSPQVVLWSEELGFCGSCIDFFMFLESVSLQHGVPNVSLCNKLTGLNIPIHNMCDGLRLKFY